MITAIQTRRVITSVALVAFAALLGGSTLSACSSDASPATGGSGGAGGSSGGGGGGGGACTGGGPATGAEDTHCGTTKTATGACLTEAQAEQDAAPAPTGDAGTGSGYGDTLYNTEGDDDDCKYHVKYSMTPVCDPAGVTFTVTVTKTADGKAVTGAGTRVEAFLDEKTISTTVNPKSTEKAGGVYEVGPVKLQKAGKWTVRFHFFENCADAPEDSPHGHAAFFVDVP